MVNIIEANRKHIEAALEYCGGTHVFDDVARAILEGRMQIWPAKQSCAVTEVIQYARKKVLHVFLAGGDLDEIVAGLESAVAWGRTQGCTGLTMSGRKGWERVLAKHGFSPVMITLEREI
jgi:hypothetical protein